MDIEAKEVIMYIRKGVLFSVKTSYRSACGHPYISGAVLVLLVLYRAFPSLFAFLFTYFPVIVCTAILLGALLSHGTPNIPNIGQEDKKTQELSSMQARSVINDLVIKKDKSLTVEAREETNSEVDEGTINEEALSEAGTSAAKETVRDMCFTSVQEEGIHEGGESSSVNEDMKETHSEKEMTEGGELCEPAFVEKGEFPADKQPEVALRLGEDGADVSVMDQKEGKSLTVQIAKPTPEDNIFDSSLGSPWHPIDSCDVSSSSDSDSGESSSPDASMTDILPMLDELRPILDSEIPQATGYSVAASSESSQDDDSDDGSAEADNKNDGSAEADIKNDGTAEAEVKNDGSADAEVENKEDKGKEETQEEKREGNEDAVTWNADDKKGVMDLGISEVERNQRLESLIAKRRARKLQRFETEKNLLDLDSYYPTPIPSISAPRSRSFNRSYNPFPGSAPSVLQPRQNPFDLPYEQVEKYSILSTEYLSHHDFVSGPQDISNRMHESSTLGTSFSNYSRQEKDSYKLKPYFDSEDSQITAFQRLLSATSGLKFSSASESDKVSSVTGHEDYNEDLLEPQVHQERNLSSANLNAHHVEQDSQSFEEVGSFDIKHTQRRVDLGDDRAFNLNTSIGIEGTCQHTDSFSAVEEEIDEAAANIPLLDVEKLEVTEERHESNSSSEENEKISDLGIHEESANLDYTGHDSLQSDRAIGIPDAHPVYDSIPSTIGELDETLLNEGKEDFISNSLPSDTQADFSEVVSPPKPLEMELSYEDRDYIQVSRSVGEELASGSGGHYISSSNVMSRDETELKSGEITEIKGHDASLVEISKAGEDVSESATEEIMPYSSFRTVKSESVENCPSDGDKDTQSERDDIMDEPPSMKESVIHQPSETDLEESEIRKSDLPSIHEENVVDFKLDKEHDSTTDLQVIKDPDLCLYDTKQVHDLKPAKDISNDASVVSSSIPPHDSCVTGMYFLEPTESTEFSTLSKTTPVEMESNNTSSHSEGNITDDKEACLEVSNHFDEESNDEIYARSTEIKEIDQGLPSELDTVGNFRVDMKQRPYQGDSDEESQYKCHFDNLKVSSAEKQDFPSQMQHSDGKPMEDAVTSIGLLSDTLSISNKVNPVKDQPTLLEFEIEPSSRMPPSEDPDSVFKQLGEKAVEPSSLGLTYDSSETSKSGVVPSDLDVIDREPEQKETDPQVLKAKPVEDTTSALKQVSEGGLHKSSLSEVEPSQDLPVGTHSEPNAEMEILEGKSLEDRNVTLKQLSEAEASQSHLESASERNVKHELNEVQYSEQIDPEDDIGGKSGMVVGKVDEKSDGTIAMPSVSDSIASESDGKEQKERQV